MNKGLLIFKLILLFTVYSTPFAHNVVLENDKIKIEFNEKNGSIEKLKNKITGWEIVRRSELALSFSMNVPKPKQRFNPVVGNSQNNVVIELNEDVNRVALIWKDLLSIHGDSLNIIFKGIIELAENGLLSM